MINTIENSLAHIKSHARNIHQCSNEIKTIKIALGNSDKQSQEHCKNILLLQKDFMFLIELLLSLMREDILKRPRSEFGEKDPILYENASTILLNLAYSDTVFVQYLILQNAIPTFISLALHSHILEIPENALQILGNIIGDDTIKTFDEIEELGIYSCLINLLKQVGLKERIPSTLFLANLSFCFSNLARDTYKKGFYKKLKNGELMKDLSDVLSHPASSLDVSEYILFVFSSLETNDDIQLLIENNIVPKIFVMCSNMLEENKVGTNAFCNIMRIFGNLASGTREQCQSILDLGLIPLFKQTLRSSTQRGKNSYNVSVSVFFTLSNVSRGTETQSSEIFDIIPELIDQYHKTQFRPRGDKLRNEITEIFIGYFIYKSSDRIYSVMKESHTVVLKILLRYLKDNDKFNPDSLFDCLSVLEKLVNFEVKKEEQTDINSEAVKSMYKTLFIEYSGPQILASLSISDSNQEKKNIPNKCREKVLNILKPHIPVTPPPLL